jgi:AraC-like DNA-binding protein
LRLRRDAVTPLVPRLDEHLAHVIPAHSPALQLLTSYVTFAFQQRALASPGCEGVLARHAIDLLALALGTPAAGRLDVASSIRAARLSALQAYVAAHLHEPALDVARIAAEHRITPRYVHKLFEASGESFARYVLRHRLELAHGRLTDERHEHLSISAIAHDAGFHDLSHFNRSFRRHFAQTPSDARRSVWERRHGAAKS